jgi:chemotaxis protein histidine kinase CheA
MWVLAGSLALTVGVQATQPVLAKPGFGQKDGEQDRRAEERRQQERAEQDRRAEERRQQELRRESERQSERDRQAQERARREQQEAERRAQREREQVQERERRAQKDAEERAAREKQAERARQAREAEQAAQAERAQRARQAREAEQAARAQKEQEQQARQRAAEERRDLERKAQAAEQARRAERAREPQTERRQNTADRARPGFGTKPEELRAERDRREAERLRRENTEAARRVEAEQRAERAREAERNRAQRVEQARQSGKIKDWGDGPGFGIKDSHRTTRGGSLDRYFNPRGGDVSYRPDRGSDRNWQRNQQRNRAYRSEPGHRHRDNWYWNDRYRYDRYGYDRYGRRYDRYDGHDDCLYDVIYIPVPGPVIVHERVDTEVVRIPEPALPEPPMEVVQLDDPELAATPPSPSERLARVATLAEVIDDVERAWITENLALLMQHLRRDIDLEIYRDGKFATALRPEEFEAKTAEAFRRFDTVSLRFAAPRSLSATEAVAAAEHRYRERDGRERRVRIVYAFIKEGDAWWIAGIDTIRLERESALPQARPAIARPVAAPATLTRATVVSAPHLRWATLRVQTRPVHVATLRGVVHGRAALYDLKAMRGLRPDTLAWGLYRRGQARPVETGTLGTGHLRTLSWVAARLSRGTLQMRNARALASPVAPAGTAVFPIRTLGAGAVLALGPAAAPQKGKVRTARR